MQVDLEQVISVLDEYRTKHGYLPIELRVRGALDHNLREYKARSSAMDKDGDYFLLLGVKIRVDRTKQVEIVR